MCYFSTLFHRTDEVVDTIIHQLKHPALGKVDMVVGIGLSGTMPLVLIHQKSGIDICAVRKVGVNSHGGNDVTTKCRPKARYVILDDFVSSGTTLKSLRARMENLRPLWECAGVLLYGECKSRDTVHTRLNSHTFDDVPIFPLGGDGEKLTELYDQEKRVA